MGEMVDWCSRALCAEAEVERLTKIGTELAGRVVLLDAECERLRALVVSVRGDLTLAGTRDREGR